MMSRLPDLLKENQDISKIILARGSKLGKLITIWARGLKLGQLIGEDE